MNRLIIALTVALAALLAASQLLGEQLAILVSLEVGVLAGIADLAVARLRRLPRPQLIFVWALASALIWGILAGFSGGGLFLQELGEQFLVVSFILLALWAFAVLIYSSWINLSGDGGELALATGGLISAVMVMWVVGAFAIGDELLYVDWTPALKQQTPERYAGVNLQQPILPRGPYLDEIVQLDAEPSDRAQLYGRVADAVVLIGNEDSFGTAFLISPGGLAITNHHVIDDWTPYFAQFRDGSKRKVRVLRWNEKVDVALLQIACEGSCAALDVAPDLELKIGDEVVVIGHPLDYSLSHTLTRGVVSGLRPKDGWKLVQTDAAVNPGNSGSPIIDVRTGRVVGVVALKISDESYEGLGFGIAIEDALAALGM